MIFLTAPSSRCKTARCRTSLSLWNFRLLTSRTLCRRLFANAKAALSPAGRRPRTFSRSKQTARCASNRERLSLSSSCPASKTDTVCPATTLRQKRTRVARPLYFITVIFYLQSTLSVSLSSTPHLPSCLTIALPFSKPVATSNSIGSTSAPSLSI